ncbi:hypothetical protein [Sulfurimonas sp.]|uniref:hypothetical protein n=1 Tax=Sulfurimonas sp. TaxID=2022749 RepID=UPI002AB21877|nr:hypothetical protein [Sulfurimonas sp.]
MKAYSINPKNKEINELDIDIQANTVYSFFNSISIDDFSIIDKHTIYSDSDAVSNAKEIFFLGEQLIVGDALVLGQEDSFDSEITIPRNELETLINYEVPSFYIDALKLLKDSNINLYKIFEVTKEKEDIKLNSEWVLYVFNIADQRTKDYFLEELKKAIDAKVEMSEHMQKMAIMALNAGAVA